MLLTRRLCQGEQIAEYVGMSRTILIGYNLHVAVLARAIILVHQP
jgi:hypothetical protein